MVAQVASLKSVNLYVRVLSKVKTTPSKQAYPVNLSTIDCYSGKYEKDFETVYTIAFLGVVNPNITIGARLKDTIHLAKVNSIKGPITQLKKKFTICFKLYSIVLHH